MDQAAVVGYLSELGDVHVHDQAGNLFFFYGSERMHPFATLMTDDVNDQASDLNRPGVFRLNVGVSRKAFKSLFGSDEGRWDFTDLDRLMPHPVYARNLWVCALNPGDQTWAALRPLIQEAYEMAVAKQGRREESEKRRAGPT